MIRFHSASGQTLIEVLTGLSILLVAMLGIMTLLSQSLGLSRRLADQAVGSYLAAEGIELAKNILDHDDYQHLATPPVGPGWGAAFGGGGSFELDYETCNNLLTASLPCSVASGNIQPYSAARLGFDPATNLYRYGGSVPTDFRRQITVTPVSAVETAVVSRVTWTGLGGSAQEAVLEDHFYNWR